MDSAQMQLAACDRPQATAIADAYFDHVVRPSPVGVSKVRQERREAGVHHGLVHQVAASRHSQRPPYVMFCVMDCQNYVAKGIRIALHLRLEAHLHPKESATCNGCWLF
jgi:hypothetical protein